MLLYSQVAWDDVWQRPQEMAVGIARHRPVVFFGPVQVSDALGRLAGRWQRFRLHPRQKNLHIACPLILPGEYKSSLIRAINRLLVTAEARRLKRTLLRNQSPLVFITNSPFCDYLPDRLNVGRVVFDVIDEFTAFAWAPPGGALREKRLLGRAQLVFTGTHTLFEKKSPQNANTHFIACGVDFERFATGSAQPEPSELVSLPRPILGFMGTLSDRIDRDLLAALARRFPSASLVLLGPVHGSFGPRIEAPNIHYLGLRPAEALPAFVARFDVALMPFAQTEAARAINPVKTLEYLAAGCRVVSTPIPDVERFYGDVVVIAPAVDPFLNAVERVLAVPGNDRVRRGIDRARQRSWSAMADEMEMRLRALESPSA